MNPPFPMCPLAIGCWGERGPGGERAEENYKVSDSCKQRNIFPVISLSPVEIGLQFPLVKAGDPVAELLTSLLFLWQSLDAV